jgi:hypothetical protein
MTATIVTGVVMKRIILRPAEAPLCACGCGQPVLCSKGRPYHWNKYLYKHISKTAEHKALIGAVSIKFWTNRKHKESSKLLMSIAHTGIPLSLSRRQNMSKAQKERKVTWGAAISKGKKGKPIWSLAERKRIGEQSRNRVRTDIECRHMSQAAKGKPKSELHCLHVSQALIALGLTGPRSAVWKGGLSKVRYAPGFTGYAKRKIAKRDGYICQVCHDDTPKRFAVHHINYDKSDHRPENLILLCASCHSRTCYNREKWIRLFAKINNRQRGRGVEEPQEWLNTTDVKSSVI